MQVWQKKKVCYVSAEDVTENKYNHNEWEESSTKIMIALHHLQLCLLEKLVTNKSNRGQKVVYSFTKMPLQVHGLFLTQSSKKTERTSISEADWKSPVSHSASPKLDPAVLKLCVLQNPTREEFSEMQLPPVTTLIQKEDVFICATLKEKDPFLFNNHPSKVVMEEVHRVINAKPKWHREALYSLMMWMIQVVWWSVT